MKIVVSPHYLFQVKEAVSYYDFLQKGLGKRFYIYTKKCLHEIKSAPFREIRYDAIRCISIPKFPFMIHFTVDEQNAEILVHAIINTHRNPNKYWLTK